MEESEIHIQRASILLSEVLDDIGVNTDIIQHRRNIHQLIQEMHKQTKIDTNSSHNLIILGSQMEGSTTPGLRSDMDWLLYARTINVSLNEDDVDTGRVNFIMVKNTKTPPGHCWLKLHIPYLTDVLSKIITCKFYNAHHNEWFVSEDGSLLLKNDGVHNDMKYVHNQIPYGETLATHGPASCVRDKYDYVVAFKCQSWPCESRCWLGKQRSSGWPSVDLLKMAKNDGCFVVPVGHPESNPANKKLEWRLSYSLTEQRLMFSLNINKMRCYVLLKIMKQTFLKSSDNTRGLTSYHLKTVLFHTIESQPNIRWEEDNLINCVINCFDTLQNMLQNMDCPHFINPNVNLFIGKLSKREADSLRHKIRDIVGNIIHYILCVNIDGIGMRLGLKAFVPNVRIQTQHEFIKTELVDAFETAKLSVISQVRYHRIHMHEKERLSLRIYHTFCIMMNGNEIEKSAAMMVLPWLLSTFAAIAETSTTAPEISHFALTYLNFGKVHNECIANLKIASIYYAKGNLLKTTKILEELSSNFISNTYVNTCGEGFVEFGKEEIKWCPFPLNYELFGSYKLKPTIEVASVDARFYFHFLCYHFSEN